MFAKIPEDAQSFVGESGRTWRYRLTPSRPDPVQGMALDGWSDADEPVYIVVLDRAERADAIERNRHAWVIERELGNPFLRRTLDMREGEGALFIVREFARTVGHKLPRPAPDEAARIERAVGAALSSLHAHDFLHGDVAPNNVFLVGDDWRLGDLELCTRVGSRMLVTARTPFSHPDAKPGVVADTRFDWYGLDKTLAWLRRAPR